MSDLAARAAYVAAHAHYGQVDKAGKPYLDHVARVAKAVSDDPNCEAVAWLHDVLEDGSAEHGRWAMAFPDDIKYAVTLLTRCTDYDYASYYDGIRANPIALRVKLADIADNADESRLALLDEKTAARLRRKYAAAIKALTGDNDNG